MKPQAVSPAQLVVLLGVYVAYDPHMYHAGTTRLLQDGARFWERQGCLEPESVDNKVKGQRQITDKGRAYIKEILSIGMPAQVTQWLYTKEETVSDN